MVEFGNHHIEMEVMTLPFVAWFTFWIEMEVMILPICCLVGNHALPFFGNYDISSFKNF